MIFSLMSCNRVLLLMGTYEFISNERISGKDLERKHNLKFCSSPPLMDDDCNEKKLYIYQKNDFEYVYFISENYQKKDSLVFEKLQDTIVIDSVRSIIKLYPELRYFNDVISTEIYYNVVFSKKLRPMLGWVTLNNNEYLAIFHVKNDIDESILNESEHVKHVIVIFCDEMVSISIKEIDEMEFQF